MKKILFITTQYRVGERIYPIIPKLAEDYELGLMKLYQMHPSYKWVGDNDMRDKFDDEYGKYFSKLRDVSEYDLIISDDNRNTPKTNLKDIYNKKNGVMIACSHGNNDKSYFISGYKKVFDYEFNFGVANCYNKEQIPSGIPSNDKLKQYIDFEKKHILVIVNFLGNRQSPFKPFNEKLFKMIGLKEIQQHFNMPIVFKLKSRDDEGGYKHNLEYLESIASDLDYSVVVDIEDDNKLIAESRCVISAPSTLAFKPIQMNIPTLLLYGTGQIGNFKDYDGFDIKVNDYIKYLDNPKDYSIFVENNIAGGSTFTSTEIMIENIKGVLK